MSKYKKWYFYLIPTIIASRVVSVKECSALAVVFAQFWLIDLTEESFGFVIIFMVIIPNNYTLIWLV